MRYKIKLISDITKTRSGPPTVPVRAFLKYGPGLVFLVKVRFWSKGLDSKLPKYGPGPLSKKKTGPQPYFSKLRPGLKVVRTGF